MSIKPNPKELWRTLRVRHSSLGFKVLFQRVALNLDGGAARRHPLLGYSYKSR